MAYLENRQGGGGGKEGAPCYREGAQSKGAAVTQSAAERLQGKSEGVLAFDTFDDDE